MKITERQQLSPQVRELWADWFPSKNTPATEIERVNANKKWLAECLLYYGWTPTEDALDIVIKFIDGGAVLYYGESPCAVISVKDNAIKITYVDNRT